MTDEGQNCVQVFDSNGQFVRKFGSKGPGNEQLDGPFGIGVLSKDHVMVFEPQNDRLQVFDAQGHFVRLFGVGMFGKGENNHIFVDSQRQYFGG